MSIYAKTIENAKYFKSAVTDEICSISCTINGVIHSVPLDPNNVDYAEIKRQIDAGELTVEDAD